MIPNMIGGRSFLEGGDADLYEGLSPREINELLHKAKFGNRSTSGVGGSGYVGSGAFSVGSSRGSKSSSIFSLDAEDPFEGMSPEEIDAMFAKQPGNDDKADKS